MSSSLLSDLRPLLHPMVVHFPIALLFASVGLDWLGYALARPGFTRAGFYLLVLGALGAGVAAIVGPDDVTGDAARALLGWHQLYALLTVMLAVGLVAVRFFTAGGIGGPWAWAYLAGTLALLFVVTMVGYYGGEMTYHQGVGVTAAVSAAAGDGIAAGPDISAKPFVALLGFFSVIALSVWLAAGRSIVPAYYERWSRAAQRAGEDTSPIWTLRRGSSRWTIQGTSQPGRTQQRQWGRDEVEMGPGRR